MEEESAIEAIEPSWLVAGGSLIAALGTAVVAIYLSRSNRTLLRASAAKAEAEGEGSSVEAAVSLIQEMRAERKELRERLEAAEHREAKTREEREALYQERQDLQREIESREAQIRYLKRVLQDAGVPVPPAEGAG